MTTQAASPIATGPGGPLFEARVAASYLLAMLLDAEPRGLPGSIITRIQLQGAGAGHPLDDVVIHADAAGGEHLTLDIQVKHQIKFSPADGPFRDVLEQVATAVKDGKLDDPHYMMAVATAQISRKIDGAYQQVLHWARRALNDVAFFQKLSMPGVGNDVMRTFVTTVRTRLKEFGAPDDDDTIWRVLCKFQIFVFDFAEQGQSDVLARDRCRQALEATQQAQAGALWKALIEFSQDHAIAAGESDRDSLRALLKAQAGFQFSPASQDRPALAALAEKSRHAISAIRDTIATAHLSRRPRVDLVNSRLDQGRYVEILGDAGVGKSGILRALAEQFAAGSIPIVLTPQRITPRGWSALRHEIGYQRDAKDLLIDLAASGAGCIFIDSADMLTDEQRATAIDLVTEAAKVPGFTVIVTARRSFGVDEPNWLPAASLSLLGRAPPIIIEELSDEEVDELRSTAPVLGPLLAPGHPAQAVARNLFRLEWLFERNPQGQSIRTEVQMAIHWWKTGDSRVGDGARDRTRILRDVITAALGGSPGPYPTRGYASVPLDALIKSGSLIEAQAEKVLFRNDVLRDWAIANRLSEDTAAYGALPLGRPAPAVLSRGVELAARMALESNSDAEAWKAIFLRLSDTGVHGSWRRAATLALIRSELGDQILCLAENELLDQDGALLGELARTIMAVDTIPAGQVFAATGIPLPDGIAEFPMPTGQAWRRLIRWSLQLKQKLPRKVAGDIANFYMSYAVT